jgi:hypothetical protein
MLFAKAGDLKFEYRYTNTNFVVISKIVFFSKKQFYLWQDSIVEFQFFNPKKDLKSKLSNLKNNAISRSTYKNAN